jgi:hypothetical protein
MRCFRLLVPLQWIASEPRELLAWVGGRCLRDGRQWRVVHGWGLGVLLTAAGYLLLLSHSEQFLKVCRVQVLLLLWAWDTKQLCKGQIVLLILGSGRELTYYSR